MLQQTKRKCMFNKETGMLVRTTGEKAIDLQNKGYRHTSKGKLKRFLNQQGKLNRNIKTLQKFDLAMSVKDADGNVQSLLDEKTGFNKSGNGIFIMPSGKIVALIKQRINPMTNFHVGQRFIIQFPN